MSYTVLGANVSPFVRKVRVVLAEKGIPYTLEAVSPFAPPPGWREVSPLGKIPALRDGDKIINDSSCICQYLERKHPAPPLLPRDDDAFIHAIWIEEFIDGGMAAVAGGKVFFPLIVAPMVAKQPADAAARAAAATVVAEELPRFWDYLEGQLDGREYFVGTGFGLADIAVASLHVNLLHARVTVDRTRWPRLAAHLERSFARPSLRALIDEEAPTWSLREA